MRAIHTMFGLLIRADFIVWYLLDLRRASSASWIPVVLIAAMLDALAALFGLRDQNALGAIISVAMIFALLTAKLIAAPPHSRRVRQSKLGVGG